MRSVRTGVMATLITLVALPVHASVLRLAWTDNAFNEVGFIIERSMQAAGPFAEVARVGAQVTAFSDVTVADGGTYCYQVRAFNGAGVSASSNVACGIAPVTPALPALTLDVTPATPTMVVVAGLVPGTTPVLVDAYIVLQAPDGSLFSLVGLNTLVPGVVPVARQFVPVPVFGEAFRYTFTGGEPAGTYRWFGALTQAGTLNLVGNLVQVPFTR